MACMIWSIAMMIALALASIASAITKGSERIARAIESRKRTPAEGGRETGA